MRKLSFLYAFVILFVSRNVVIFQPEITFSFSLSDELRAKIIVLKFLNLEKKDLRKGILGNE